MKQKLLLYLLLLISSTAFGQNVAMNKTNGWLRTMLSAVAQDSVMMSYGAGTNGYIPIYNSTLKKNVYTDPSTIVPTLSVSTVSTGGYANGLNYAAGVFRLGKVSATNPGVLTTGTDTIAGSKRFNSIMFTQGGILSGGDITVSAGGTPSISVISTDGNATGRISRFNSGSTASLDFQTNGGNTWELSTLSTSSDFTIRNATGSVDAIRVNNSTNALTLSSLTTGSVYSSSGTLTNTAPTSGTIGYWSRNSGTGTLTTATGTDAVTLGGALTGTTATFSGTITSTRTSGAILNAVSSTTGSPFVNFQSTSGQLLTGIEASAGGSIATGSTAYSTFFGNQVAKPIDFFTNGVVRYTIDASGNNTWTGGGSFGGAVTGVTASPNSNDTKFATTAYVDNATGGGLTFDSDTYTPTLTNGANVSSSAATTNHYIRVGNQVSISGKVNVTPTAAAGTNTVISLSLPVASNFANQADVSGIVNVYNNVSATAIGIVNANSGTDLIEINFGSLATTGHTVSYSLQYTVL